VGGVWASEEDMAGEIDRKRRVLSGEGYGGGGTRSHGLKLGKRLRDRVSVSMMDRFETNEIRESIRLGFYVVSINVRQRARVSQICHLTTNNHSFFSVSPSPRSPIN